MASHPVHPRAWLLIPGGLALLAGLDGALLLLGVSAPLPADRFADAHGPVMVLAEKGATATFEVTDP